MPASLLEQLTSAQQNAPACALCHFEKVQVARYLEGVGNDGVNNIPLRQRLLRKGGYCPKHSAEFAHEAHVLSSAILLESFITPRLERAKRGRVQAVDCEACEVARKTRQSLSKSLARERKSEALHQLLMKMELCLEHLELVCKELPDNVRQALVARHDVLLRDLAELIRKYDYRFVHEKRTAEEDGSIQRVLRLLGSE